MCSIATTRQERFFLYNSLAILLKAVEGERTTVDLRNEASIFGVLEQADGFMNIFMKDCVFTDPRGDRHNYEIFFVQARNIRTVHIPAHIRIIPAIKEQLLNLAPITRDFTKRTFKSKRAQERQAEGVAAVKEFLKKKEDTLKQEIKEENVETPSCSTSNK